MRKTGKIQQGGGSLAMGMLAHGLYNVKCVKMHNDIGPLVASALSGTLVV